MKRVLIFDVETTNLNPAVDQIIEVGYVLWSVEHRTSIETHAAIFPGHDNPAEQFNGLHPDMLRTDGCDQGITWALVADAARRADAIVAHYGKFDQSFVVSGLERGLIDEAAMGLFDRHWICTMEDVVWPSPSSKRSLIEIALAHGVAVTSAHRAVNDCLLLARLCEAVPNIGMLLDEGLARAIRPKAEFVTNPPMDQNAMVKAAGFAWDGERRVWHRHMAIEDAEKLPFEVMRTAPP